MNYNTATPPPFTVNRLVRSWLLLGVVMVFFQIFIGGVTRLTGSGLSITKWEIVTGTLPPVTSAAWDEAFALYQATPQYQKINTGMSMTEFQFIYFWEYFHRLWARLMLFAFLIPFFYFLYRNWIPMRMIKNLGLMLVFAVLAAIFGWIMVASGLNSRPWVSAYKLSIHFSLGITIFSTLFWVYLKTRFSTANFVHKSMWKSRLTPLLLVSCVQIILGALMSGMKAGLYYPTWPDMHGEMIPAVIFESQRYTFEQFMAYDSNSFVPALIQFLHRNTAYLLTIWVIWYYFKVQKSETPSTVKRSTTLLLCTLLVQVLLGIITILNCGGHIPVALGVAHQAGAVALFAALINCRYHLTDFSSVDNSQVMHRVL
jgi:heme a synthase